MDSNGTNNQNAGSGQNYGAPRADDILRGLEHNNDPVSFIKSNLKRKNAEHSVITPSPEVLQEPSPSRPAPVDQASPQVSPQLPTQLPIETPSLFSNNGVSNDTPPQEPSKPLSEAEAPKLPEETKEVSTELDFTSEIEIPPEAVNFKKLRTKFKETARTLKEREVETQTLKQTIEKYEKGEVDPELINNLKTKIEELEPYQYLHDLKRSEAYQDKFISPINNLSEKLKALGKDYEISEEALEHATTITNTRDLNQFLLNHFDDVGALEAKQVITQIQSLHTDAKNAEDQPRDALERLTQEHQEIAQEKDRQRKNNIAESSKSAWQHTINEIRSEGKIKELIPRENDPDFNERYPYAIQKKAAQEYGRIVSELAEAGVKEINPVLNKALARLTLLSITSGISMARANAAEEELEALYKNTSRENQYARPNFQSTGATRAQAQGAKPSSPIEAGRSIMNSILAKG